MSGHAVTAIASPSRRTFSCGTTRVAPAGSSAPVKMRRAVPSASGAPGPAPGTFSPSTRNVSPEPGPIA
ncbi:MAG: hypothetical protein WDO13_16610 [Verrucomicrobiota bacterium]